MKIANFTHKKNNARNSSHSDEFSRLIFVGGFTLIELLVVIVIVGVLSSIALPSFLNQVSKARASEAKSSTGAILRAQQAYRYQTGTFTDQLSNLDISIQQGKYNYSIQNNLTTSYVEMRALPQSDNDLNRYAGAVSVDAEVNFRSIICESNDNVAAGGDADIIVPGFTCNNTSHEIN